MKRFALLLALIMALPVVGVAQGSAVTIVHPYPPEQRAESAACDGFHALLGRYREAHPERLVQERLTPPQEYAARFLASASAGSMPELFYLAPCWLPQLARDGLAQPLDGLLAAREETERARPELLEAGAWQGRQYGLPTELDVWGLVVYSRALWREAGFDGFPDCWPDILRAQQAFDGREICALTMGSPPGRGGGTLLAALGDRFTGARWTRGLSALNAQSSFTDPQFVDALRQVQELTGCGALAPPGATRQQACLQLLEGRAAACLGGAWEINYLAAHASDEQLSQLALALLPPVERGRGAARSAVGGGGWYLAMASGLDGAERAAAEQLLEQLSGRALSEYLLTTHGLPGPVALSGTEPGFVPLIEDFRALAEDVALSPPYWEHLAYPVTGHLEQGMLRLLAGEVSPERLAEELQGEQERCEAREAARAGPAHTGGGRLWTG